MKPILIRLLIPVIWLLVQLPQLQAQTATEFVRPPDVPPPPLNQKMLDFAHDNMGKQIGRGICAEFVSAAVEHSTGVHYWRTGRRVDTRVEWIQPGDILYMSWKKGKRSHVAVILEVHAPHLVTVAHQNFNKIKHVVTTEYDLNQKIREGRIVKIYRPELTQEK